MSWLTFFRSLQQGPPRLDQGHLALVRPVSGLLSDRCQPFHAQRAETCGSQNPDPEAGTNPVQLLPEDLSTSGGNLTNLLFMANGLWVGNHKAD